MKELCCIALGYLLGSILFAKLISNVLNCGDITENSADKNPGTANAFLNGGFLCGMLTLCGDILKGFFPVWLYLRICGEDINTPALAFVMAAPVLGHIFPVFFNFHGGKGIAVSFGCLLGLLPEYRPLLILAGCFIFFSCVIRIDPNIYRTALAYICAEILMPAFVRERAILLGFTLTAAAVIFRLYTSREEKKDLKVGLLWTR